MIILVASCSTGEGSIEQVTTTAIPACEAVFVEGAITSVSLLETICDDGSGAHVYGHASTDCTDGRVLMWSDAGWGYEGAAFHPHPVDDVERVPPQAERDACS